MKTLGALLPKKQAKLLTPKVRRMSRSKLEKEIASHPKSDLSYKDLAGLKKLAVNRINNGLSMYTWDKHNFHPGDDEQEPSTCITI